MCRTVSLDLAAFFAFMNYDIALFRVGFNFYRVHYTAARICPVAGIYIYMQRAKTSRTMISGTVAKGLNLKPAIFADKRIVIFFKKFLLRKAHLR